MAKGRIPRLVEGLVRALVQHGIRDVKLAYTAAGSSTETNAIQSNTTPLAISCLILGRSTTNSYRKLVARMQFFNRDGLELLVRRSRPFGLKVGLDLIVERFNRKRIVGVSYAIGQQDVGRGNDLGHR